MEELNEGDSVVLHTDNFDTNGVVGKIVTMMRPLNRCIVELESGSRIHVPLHYASKRNFLSE